MAEKPILLSTQEVRSILAGRKTQVRRVVKPQPVAHSPVIDIIQKSHPPYKNHWLLKTAHAGMPCDGKHYGGYWVRPSCQTGDILYVRETWRWCADAEGYCYKASRPYTFDNCRKYESVCAHYPKWRSSATMPRAAARIFLRVTGVRVERVQSIAMRDCIKEGIELKEFGNAKHDYAELWDSCYAKKGYGWDSNPWVWVYDFERVI